MPQTAAEAQALRIPQLHRRRDIKMARDAHAYVRGSTERFYEWLASTQGRSIPQGPAVWICGDAHVGNLGPIARCDEQIEVELRDLDQTVPGNPAHDLVRLALSLAMAARSSDLPGVVTARLVEELMSGHLDAFAHPEDTSPDLGRAAVRFVVREALRRKWRHLHRERIGKKPRFPLGDRFLPLAVEGRRHGVRGERMLAGTVLNHPVFVRELMPQDLKLELEMLDDGEARATARASSHRRSRPRSSDERGRSRFLALGAAQLEHAQLGRAAMALGERRRADRDPRARLPRALQALRAGAGEKPRTSGASLIHRRK